MNARLKHILTLLLPPIVLEARRRLLQRPQAATSVAAPVLPTLGAVLRAKPEWEAVPNSDAVWTAAEGWSHMSIVDTQRSKWSDFIKSVETPRPFGVSHEAAPGATPDVSPHNAVMTFGYALGLALAGQNAASVLDWGGGLGHYAVYARALYPGARFDYVVKDLESLCDAGRALLPDVTFISDENAALSRQYDLVFASSSLHYTRDFYGLLGKVCASAGRYLMVTRIPVVSEHDDFVVVQRPHRYGYLTEYAGWFVNRKRLISFIEGCGFCFEREFLLGERPAVPNAPEQCVYGGFLFERRPPPERAMTQSPIP
jgi:putative methyltransferase (TIGR04325 family)